MIRPSPSSSILFRIKYILLVIQGISEKCTGAFKVRVPLNILKYLSIQKLPQKRSIQSIWMYIMTPVLKTSRRLLLWNIVRYTFSNKAVLGSICIYYYKFLLLGSETYGIRRKFLFEKRTRLVPVALDPKPVLPPPSAPQPPPRPAQPRNLLRLRRVPGK